MFGKYTSWTYFLTNYERINIARSGSHGFLILNHMNYFVFNSNNNYPHIVSNLNKCKEISDKYFNDDNYIKTDNDDQVLQQTINDIYNVAPPLFKYSVKFNEMWINKKRSMGFKHDEYKGDTTLLESFCEKVFK